MTDIQTEVLIIGTGPAGSATAALLSSYGVENMVINQYNWLARTPRAHITNQRTMEVLRDLGQEVEAEGYLHASPKELMGENVFCTSLAGEELGRIKSWGTDPLSDAEHKMSSPSLMNDLPQTFMEPILFKTACARGTQARMSTEYISHVQDEDGVTTTCLDKLTGKKFTVRSKYLVGADGGNSMVAEHIDTPFVGEMAVAGSMNILIRADLSKYVAHRPSVLYWVLQPGADVGGLGMGVVRMIRPWNEWLLIWGYDINGPVPEVDDAFATKIARDLIGDQDIDIELISTNTWTVNNMYATNMQNDRVFIMGDAAHRHPPGNGLGSNTSIQDGFNLAWKLAHVLQGKAGPKLLESYSEERVPVGKQIVARANKSIGDYGRIFDALGLTSTNDVVEMKKNMDRRLGDTPEAAKHREALRDAIAYKKYEYDAHGVEMNQRYSSGAIQTDGQIEPEFELDSELHYQPTTWPGARIPHVWVFDKNGAQVSTLDLCGHGKFSLLTSISGRGWAEAAKGVAKNIGLEIDVHIIGPNQPYEDLAGDWARACEVQDGGAILVRPDHHVCWRSDAFPQDAEAQLMSALRGILGA